MDTLGSGGIPAKILRPRPTARVLSRPGLNAALDEALKRPVTTAVSPAGFGKTWLVVDWLEAHQEIARCWVTIDSYDSDPMRFWSYVLRSIHDAADSSETAEPLRVLTETGAGIPLVIDALARGLAEWGKEILIVFDDVHHLAAGESLDSLTQFLDQLPTNAHVVLIGRSEPDLSLARRRVSGELVEIGVADMQMSLPETRALIAECMSLDLDGATVEEIHEKTMGWIAGSRLAATAATGADGAGSLAVNMGSAKTHGAYDAIGDYLVQEALNELDGAERRFLLDTSILVNLSGPLCDAVSGRTDSAALLDRFAREGMFTSRIDEEGEWYRYHDLFREVLQSLLRRMSPDLVPELDHRAATWLHDNGSLVSAIQHALAGGDAELAARWLLEHSRTLLMAKQFDTMCRLFSEIDEASQLPLPPAFMSAWMFPILFGSAPGTEIDAVLERGRERLVGMSAAEESAATNQWKLVPFFFHESPAEMIRAVDATIAHRRGDVELADSVLEAQELEGPSESGWIEGAASELLIYTGRYSRGLELLKPWNDYAFSPANPIIGNQAYSSAMQAYAALGEGRLSEAEVFAARGVEVMHTNALGALPQAAVPAVPLGWAKWEVGDLDSADEIISPALGPIAHLAEVPSYVLAYVLLARVRGSRGDVEGAVAALDEATAMHAGTRVSGYFADLIALERARSALILGDFLAAEFALPDWRERAERGAATMREHLALARMAVAAGDDAAPLLDSPPSGAEVTPYHEIEILMLRALLAQRERNEAAALEILTEAMKKARVTGHRQMLLDEELAFGALVDNAAAMSDHDVRKYQVLSPAARPKTGPAHVLYDSLTERELEVLRLLASHRTYREIGEELFVSTNTVKFYVKSIYSKLGANKRGEAVAAAQALHLID